MPVASQSFEDLEFEVRAAEQQVITVTGAELRDLSGRSAWTTKAQGEVRELLRGMSIQAVPDVPGHPKHSCYLVRNGSAVEKLSNAFDQPTENHLATLRQAGERIEASDEMQTWSLLDKARQLVEILERRDGR